MTLSRSVLVSLLCAAGTSLEPRTVPAQAAPAGTDATLEVAEDLREEHFLLELLVAQPSGATVPQVVGAATWRRRSGAAQQLELELSFFEDATRVLHVEHDAADGSMLVWREWRPGGGRTLVVRWGGAADAAELVEWGREQVLRTRLDAAGTVLLPLHLVELARSGVLAEGRSQCFDPLSRAVEPLEVRIREERDADTPEARGPGARRTIELWHADGSSAGSFSFSGEELTAFRWQAGDLAARRVSPREQAERVAAAVAPPTER